jgi:hypothetical protein
MDEQASRLFESEAKNIPKCLWTLNDAHGEIRILTTSLYTEYV